MGKKSRIKRNYPYIIYLFLKLWGMLHFSKNSKHIHTARYSRTDELRNLFSKLPPPNGLHLGVHTFRNYVVSVQPSKDRRELGNVLVVAPTRGGKSLLAITQLLTWEDSVIVNDIKGELYDKTAGYRSTRKKDDTTKKTVFVVDPTGYGDCYDPLAGKTTEEQFNQAAKLLLYVPDEKDPIFTQRAIVMLTQIFLAASKEKIPAFLYTRSILRMGLPDAAERLNSVDPEIATQFLNARYDQADFKNKFLISAFETLYSRINPILTPTRLQSLAKSDFTAEDIIQGKEPITVYFKWQEQQLPVLAPFIRMMWISLLDELITTYDVNKGKDCRPVLALIDEAGRSGIPQLDHYSSTVAGRNISLQVFFQSRSQLVTNYGKSEAETIESNMLSKIYYPPGDLATAEYLEKKLGDISAFAQSTTKRDGREIGEGSSEHAVPLLTKQQLMYDLKDYQIIMFQKGIWPSMLHRIDYRDYPEIEKRTKIPAPTLQPLPELPDIPPMEPAEDFHYEYIDPDRPPREETQSQTVFLFDRSNSGGQDAGEKI